MSPSTQMKVKFSHMNRSLGPVLTLLIITIFVNAVFQDILALTRVTHIVSSRRVTTDRNVVISNIEMQMNCYIPVFFKKNGFLMPISCTHHTLQQITYSWVIDTLCQLIRELFTSLCHHLGRNISSNYIQEHTFQDYYIKHTLFSSYQDHFLVQS